FRPQGLHDAVRSLVGVSLGPVPFDRAPTNRAPTNEDERGIPASMPAPTALGRTATRIPGTSASSKSTYPPTHFPLTVMGSIHSNPCSNNKIGRRGHGCADAPCSWCASLLWALTNTRR